ncbi:MAG: CoA-binding protein [Chloroflexi bacterium]|nr:CoA-binding protein [Chloroflexota bacterium]
MFASPVEAFINWRSVAVVGAGHTPEWNGGGFVAGLLEHGFDGKIYPVNPKHPEIMGLKSYPSLRDIPEPIDYVISSVPARAVLQLLEDAAYKRVKAVHLFTARFSETGRPEAVGLERNIQMLARKLGIRLIGPNCMGVYFPAGKIAWQPDLPRKSGAVGMASQSGMLGRETAIVSRLRGVHYSKVFSYGNAIDLNERDFLEYFAQDPDTKVVLLYIEGTNNGRELFKVLRQTAAVKPVVILKGGRGKSGTRATASHTAALAGVSGTWKTMVAQAGAVWADSLEDLHDLAAAFNFLPPIMGRQVGVAAGSGGHAVLAADLCEEAGLDVIPLPPDFRAEIKNRGISVWDWLGNPIDNSIREDASFTTGVILEMMAHNPNFDLIITSVGGLRVPGEHTDTYLEREYHLSACRGKALLAVVPERVPTIREWESREWKATSEIRAGLIDHNIPFYPTFARAASTARKVLEYYQRREQKV